MTSCEKAKGSHIMVAVVATAVVLSLFISTVWFASVVFFFLLTLLGILVPCYLIPARWVDHFSIKDIGLDVAVIGSIVSCVGVIANNLMLDHILAMQIWMFSNIILLVWSYGLWKNWWNGGISGMVLCGMYAFYAVTNVWGLMHV